MSHLRDNSLPIARELVMKVVGFFASNTSDGSTVAVRSSKLEEASSDLRRHPVTPGCHFCRSVSNVVGSPVLGGERLAIGF